MIEREQERRENESSLRMWGCVFALTGVLLVLIICGVLLLGVQML